MVSRDLTPPRKVPEAPEEEVMVPSPKKAPRSVRIQLVGGLPNSPNPATRNSWWKGALLLLNNTTSWRAPTVTSSAMGRFWDDQLKNSLMGHIVTPSFIPLIIAVGMNCIRGQLVAIV